MKRLTALSLGVALQALLILTPARAEKPAQANGTTSGPSVAVAESVSAIVQLKGEPLSTYTGTHPARGKKIDFNSDTVKSYRAGLSALRNDFKAWLRANAPAVKVTSEFDISLNAVAVELNGVPMETLRQSPQVLNVQVQGSYRPNTADPDLSLIHAVEAWAFGGGAANAGAGVKVAIIDSGIDIRHPCFSDSGYPPQQRVGDPRFTNNKVIAARVFNNKAVSHGYTAEAIESHGTHVAGTVGCNFDTLAVINGVAIPHGVSGVAPRALLGNYNVFPGNVADARSEDILNALEAAYQDGFDVANMSLGGDTHGIQDLDSIAVDNLDQANMVVAVSAGNDGPALLTVGSPGSAARALTAGASTVGHLLANSLTAGGSTFLALAGQFPTIHSDLTGPLAVLAGPVNGLSTACTAPAPGSLSGKIALISRGTCTFSTKLRNLKAAGAVAVIVANNAIGDPVEMGQDGTPDQPDIPAYMVGLDAITTLAAQNGSAVTLSASVQYFITPNADFIAAFSSRGPTDVDFRVKPDVVAPGVNVLSSFPVANCDGDPCWAFLQGTSMSSPHLAGSAAVLRSLHPDWSAAQVRSAIVNTADRNVLRQPGSGAPETDANAIGTGRENLLAAVSATVALDPVSVSFGAVPSGSGQTKTRTVTVSNLTGSAKTYSVSVEPGGGGVSYSAGPASISLGAGGTATVTVTMSAAQRAAAGGHSATLTLSSAAGEAAHAVVFTWIK
jgi:subtilisin family serine protease